MLQTRFNVQKQLPFFGMNYPGVGERVRLPPLFVEPNSSMCVAVTTYLYATGFRVRVSILDRERDFSLLQHVQTGSGTHPACYSVGTGVLAGGKATGA